MRFAYVVVIGLLLAFASCSRCEGDCQNGGVCDLDSCYCPKGYSGPNCEEFDLCQSTNCQNGFMCINGSCPCEFPYFGIDCSGDLRTTYSTSYSCAFDYRPSYQVRITGSAFGTSFLFENLVGFRDVIFSITNNNSISIQRQHLGSGIYISGEGAISSDFQSIVLTYDIEDTWSFPSTVPTCTTTLNRIN